MDELIKQIEENAKVLRKRASGACGQSIGIQMRHNAETNFAVKVLNALKEFKEEIKDLS